MKREFLFNIVLLVIINLLVKVSYLFFIEVEIQNTLGPEKYGLFLALFNFSSLLQFINDPGLQSHNSTLVASGEKGVTSHIRYTLGLKVLLSATFVIAVMAAAYVVGYRDEEVRSLLFLIAINQVLSTGYMFLRSNLSALGFYRYDTFISALDKLLMIAILGYILIFHSETLTLTHFVLGQMGAYVIACIVALSMLMRKGIPVVPGFSISKSMDTLKGAAPFALILLLMASYNKMDGVMLERLIEGGAYHAGIYAASLRFMDAANMGAYLMAALLLPMFASQHNEKGMISQLSGLAIRLMTVYVTIICVVGINYRYDLMGIYDAYDAQYGNLLIFHLLSFGCVAISYVYGTLLTATRKLRKMNYVLILGLLINLALNLWLIPRIFAEGAAIATLITQATVMAGQVILATSLFNLRVNVSQIIRALLFVIIAYGVVYTISQVEGVKWVYGAIISVGMVTILSFFLGIVRKDMIFALLKQG